MAEQTEFDPRFNPAFQRGFSGARAAVVPSVPARVAPVDEPARVDQTPATPGQLASEPHDDEDPAPSLRGNPWAAALWIASVALVVGGVWAQWHAATLFASSTASGATDFYVVPTVINAMAPWFVGVGLLGVLGAVMLHAARWRPSR